MKMPAKPRLADWIDSLLAIGCHTFTFSEAVTGSGRTVIACQAALRRLKKQRVVVSPRKGFFVIVNPEYRAIGSPPASWFVDYLMEYLGQPYYVGMLSSAALFGAAHQAPMSFQVVTDKPTRPVLAGSVKILFTMDKKVTVMPTVRMNTQTGTMRVASPETTAFDLVRHQAAGAYLNNIAMVLDELSERLDPTALLQVAELATTRDVQRLGYILDFLNKKTLSDPLFNWLSTRRPRMIPLRPDGPKDATPDLRWHILPNEKLELDL